MGRLGCEGARRKAQQYLLVLRAFATLQTHCPNGPGTPHLQFRGVYPLPFKLIETSHDFLG